MYRLDSADTVVWAAHTMPIVAAAVGTNLWAAFPGLREAGLGTIISQARERGVASGAVFYAGTLGHVAAVSLDGTVTVSVVAVPLENLKAALEDLDGWLQAGRPVAA